MTIFYDFDEKSLYALYTWIAAIAMPLGLILLAIAWHKWFVALEFLHYNRTNGTVDRIETSSSGAAILFYTYTVDGKAFTTSRKFSSGQPLPTSLDDPLSATISSGARIAVLYDPRRPERAHINPQPPHFPYLELALGGSFTFFGVISLVCICYLLWAKTAS